MIDVQTKEAVGKEAKAFYLLAEGLRDEERLEASEVIKQALMKEALAAEALGDALWSISIAENETELLKAREKLGTARLAFAQALLYMSEVNK